MASQAAVFSLDTEMKAGDADMTSAPPLGPIRPNVLPIQMRAGKRKRRERQPNWETKETFALVRAKKAEHDEWKREQLVPFADVIRWYGERSGDLSKKWAKVAEVVCRAGASSVIRSAESCKDKWGQLNGEYKKIQEYEKGRAARGNRNPPYWELRAKERQEFHLPKTFHSRELYEMMDGFLNNNPRPPRLNMILNQNAALRELSSDHASGSRSHQSETPLNIKKSFAPPEVSHSTSHSAPVAANTRELRPPSCHRSQPVSNPQHLKHVGEKEAASAAIRDRLARLRERICASDAGSPDTESDTEPDTEPITASETRSLEVEAVPTKDGSVTVVEGKQYECIQAAFVAHGTVGLVRLDRPKALNALSQALMLELVDALQTFDASTQVGAIVITGTGEAFSAGIDIQEITDTSGLISNFGSCFAHHWNAFSAIRKPIIAAMNGYALGRGAELAMMCDIILAGENAQFGQPEVKLGTIPGVGGSQRLIREVGKSRAMEMILTGKHFMNPDEAAERGLVSRVVPGDDGTLVGEAVSLAREIAQKSKPVVALAKEIVNSAYETGLAEGLKKERLLSYARFGLGDQKG